MTALAWLALAVGLVLAPLPSLAWRRTLGLSRRGRLAAVTVHPSRLPWLRRSRPPPRALGLCGCVVAAVAAYAVGGPALGLAGAVVAATAATLISSALAQRRESRRRRGLLAAIRLVVAELSAGSRPAAALGAAATVAPDHSAALAAAASSAAAGGDVADLLLTAAPHSGLGPLAHAWRVAERSGAPLADVLGRVAADLADQEQQQRSVTVALAGPRSSAALLAGLPVVGIALGAAVGARPLAFLLGTPYGRVACCVGAVLDAAGVMWTQRLMQQAQRA